MGTGRLIVHLGGGHSPIFITDFHDVIHLLLGAYISFCDVVDEDALHLVCFYVEVDFSRVQQVFYAFHVNLSHGHFYRELDVFGRIVDSVEYGSHHSRDDALHLIIINVGPLHGEGFSRPGLPVGEHRAVEAFDHAWR